jgi:CheY-like chemotaxis protein
VADSVKLLRAMIPSTVKVTASIDEAAPSVLADSNQIHQVLTNLGVNAWHAMKDGGGVIALSLDRLVVDAAHASQQPGLAPGLYARVSVSDSGCGMDEATRKRIFEPFFTTKGPGEGTGLGLSVVHGIMNNHEGAVTVYSNPGEGSIFHLYFPAHESETIVDDSEDGAIPRGCGERVLVVDDEKILAVVIQKALLSLGYAAEYVLEPAAALTMVRASPTHFALIVTDQTMPGITGLSLATQIHRTMPVLPIILMTGFSASVTPERVDAAGVRQVLLKPTSVRALGEAVHAAILGKPPSTLGSAHPYRR